MTDFMSVEELITHYNFSSIKFTRFCRQMGEQMKIIHSLKSIYLDAKTIHTLSIKLIKQRRKICRLIIHRS